MSDLEDRRGTGFEASPGPATVGRIGPVASRWLAGESRALFPGPDPTPAIKGLSFPGFLDRHLVKGTQNRFHSRPDPPPSSPTPRYSHLKPSKVLLVAVLTALVFSATSCGTWRRLGKDVYITAISPLLIPAAAAADSYRDATATREGYQTGAITEVLSFPLFFMWNTVKHAGYCFVHLLDIPLNLYYGASEMMQLGPEIEPIDYYQSTWFDKRSGLAGGTNAESGETGR